MVVRGRPETRQRLNREYRERHRIRLREADRLRRVRIREEALEHYGRTCARCGFAGQRALQIDHIDDSGAIERRELGGKNFSGWRFYMVLKKRGWPPGYQTLCANCNVIKQFEALVRIG